MKGRLCLVTNGVWQVSLLSIDALCDGLYKLDRSNAALVDRNVVLQNICFRFLTTHRYNEYQVVFFNLKKNLAWE